MRVASQKNNLPMSRSKIVRLRWMILLCCFLAALAVTWNHKPQAQSPAQPRGYVPHRPLGLSRFEETGKRLYVALCVYCHGVRGDGFGLNTPNLAVPPRDHTDAAYMALRTDEELFAVIKYGGASQGKSALMPPWGGRLNDREISALVAYLRLLSNPAVRDENVKQ